MPERTTDTLDDRTSTDVHTPPSPEIVSKDDEQNGVVCQSVKGSPAQKNPENEDQCNDNIEGIVKIDYTPTVKYAVRTDGKDSKKALFDEVYKAISDNLDCEYNEREEVCFNLKVDVGKRIYKGKPTKPTEEYAGKCQTIHPMKWFVEKYHDVVLYSSPKYKSSDLKKDNSKLHKAMQDVFSFHPEEIQELNSQKVFHEIGVFREPKSMAELFGKKSKMSHVEAYNQTPASSVRDL